MTIARSLNKIFFGKEMKYLWLLFSSAQADSYLFRAVENSRDIGDKKKKKKRKNKEQITEGNSEGNLMSIFINTSVRSHFVNT